MTEVADVAVFVGRLLVSTLAMALSSLLLTYNYCKKNYPDFTAWVTLAVVAYLGYRILKRVLRMWIGFMYSMVKMTFYAAIAASCLLIYLRGFHTFFFRDIPHIKAMFDKGPCNIDWIDYITGYANSWSNAYSKYDFLRRSGRDWVTNNEDTIHKVEGHYHGAESYVMDNLDGIENFLKDTGADPDTMRQFFNQWRN